MGRRNFKQALRAVVTCKFVFEFRGRLMAKPKSIDSWESERMSILPSKSSSFNTLIFT